MFRCLLTYPATHRYAPTPASCASTPTRCALPLKDVTTWLLSQTRQILFCKSILCVFLCPDNTNLHSPQNFPQNSPQGDGPAPFPPPCVVFQGTRGFVGKSFLRILGFSLINRAFSASQATTAWACMCQTFSQTCFSVVAVALVATLATFHPSFATSTFSLIFYACSSCAINSVLVKCRPFPSGNNLVRSSLFLFSFPYSAD